MGSVSEVNELLMGTIKLFCLFLRWDTDQSKQKAESDSMFCNKRH